MSSKKSIVALAKETIAIESLAIAQLADFIDDTFAEAVELIYNSTGRVIITGIGKSAIIANKIVATSQFHGHSVRVYACRRRHSWRFRTDSYGR